MSLIENKYPKLYIPKYVNVDFINKRTFLGFIETNAQIVSIENYYYFFMEKDKANERSGHLMVRLYKK